MSGKRINRSLWFCWHNCSQTTTTITTDRETHTRTVRAIRLQRESVLQCACKYCKLYESWAMNWMIIVNWMLYIEPRVCIRRRRCPRNANGIWGKLHTHTTCSPFSTADLCNGQSWTPELNKVSVVRQYVSRLKAYVLRVRTSQNARYVIGLACVCALCLCRCRRMCCAR